MSLVFMKKLFKFHGPDSLDLSSISGMFKLFVIFVVTILTSINLLMPNVNYSGRTAPLTS